MILAIATLVLFLIPYTVSMFAGQHTFYDVCDMDSKCIKCHKDVWEQLDSCPTVYAHKNAANNKNYTTYMAVGGIEYDGSVIYTMDFTDGTHDDGDVAYFQNDHQWEKRVYTGSSFEPTGESMLISLDTNGDAEIDTSELCSFCHNTTLFGLSGVHTMRTVRVCDDDRCHGNRNHTYNDPDFFEGGSGATHVGMNLSHSVHGPFYLSASGEPSPNVAGMPFGHEAGNVHGQYISKGYWTCMGCHSEAGVAIAFGDSEHYGHGHEDEPTRYR